MMAATRGLWGRYLLLAVAVVLVNFFLPRVLPGSPLAGGAGESSVFLPTGTFIEVRRAYGLDRPVAEQFLTYLDGLRHGDLGRSLATHRPVAGMIGERLPWTVFLVGSSAVVAAALGAALGTVAAWRPRGPGARVAGPLIIGLGALPEILVATALIVAFGTRLRIFPVGGAMTPFLGFSGPTGWMTAARDIASHAALPGAALVLGLAPAFFMLSRNALAAVAGAPYLRTARGKGLGGRRVLWHAWRNALPPVLTLVGLRLAFAVTGAALVERIFAYPGMGLLLFEAVVGRDYPVMQGVLLVASLVVLVVNAVLDLAALTLDPRLRRPAS